MAFKIIHIYIRNPNHVNQTMDKAGELSAVCTVQGLHLKNIFYGVK
jgi:hypothetical protein